MANAPKENTPEMDPLQKMLGPSDIEAFVDKYKVQLLLGFVGVIALIALAFVLKASGEERRTEIANAFTAATTIEELDKVASEYNGTVAGGNALIRKAALLEEEGKKDEVQSTLGGFLTTYPNHPRKDQVLLILGRLAESEEKWSLARSYYQQVDLDSEAIGYAKLHLGDILMQEGKYEEAETYYGNIYSELTGTDYFNDLQSRKDMASKKVAMQKNPVMPMLPEPQPTAEEKKPAAEEGKKSAEEAASTETPKPEAEPKAEETAEDAKPAAETTAEEAKPEAPKTEEAPAEEAKPEAEAPAPTPAPENS